MAPALLLLLQDTISTPASAESRVPARVSTAAERQPPAYGVPSKMVVFY